MKTNPNYTICNFDGTSYLLPFGQAIADHQRGMQLSESGIFLWNNLPDVQNKEEPLNRFLAHYEAAPEDVPVLTQDLNHFIFLLTSLGIIPKDWKESPFTDFSSLHLQIGTVHLCLRGNEKAFPKEFLPFKTDSSSTVDLTVELRTGHPPISDNGTVLIQNEQLRIWEYADYYRLLFPEAKQLNEAYLSKEGTFSCIYYIPANDEELLYELFHAIRLLYLYIARMKGCYALHSASLLYHDKAWLFAGHSGMGKSTHTRLWNTLFDTPLLNGDLNLLAFLDGKPVIYGIPWCGTSGIADSKTYPLGGIILLSQAEQDECVELSANQQTLLIMQRLISPAWTASMLEENLAFTNKLSKQIHVCRLKCTKNPSAAHTMKQWIDEHPAVYNR